METLGGGRKKEGAPMAPSKRKEKEECVLVALLFSFIDLQAGSLYKKALYHKVGKG